MREWADSTVERICALKPRRVLEIGCGTGLLLFRVAPYCEHYEAVDLSEAALEMIWREAGRRGLNNLRLRRAAAADLRDLPDASFDLVVINSVVQYFPGVEYLVEVLTKTVAAVRPGGAIFVGDIRNHDLMEAFHASLELHRAPDSLSVEDLRRRVRERRDGESELLVAPGFFSALRDAIPDIGHVTIQLKRGRRNNEMTQFRYDALLRIGECPASRAETAGPAPQPTGWTLASIRERLDSKPAAVVFAGLENPRLTRELRALEYLHGEQCPATAGELKGTLSRVAKSGIHPEELWGLEIPYDIELTWSLAHGPGSFDAIFRRQGVPPLILTCISHKPPADVAQALLPAASRLVSTPVRRADTVSKRNVGMSADAAGKSACATSLQPNNCEKYGQMRRSWHEFVNLPRVKPAAGTLTRELKDHVKAPETGIHEGPPSSWSSIRCRELRTERWIGKRCPRRSRTGRKQAQRRAFSRGADGDRADHRRCLGSVTQSGKRRAS